MKGYREAMTDCGTVITDIRSDETAVRMRALKVGGVMKDAKYNI